MVLIYRSLRRKYFRPKPALFAIAFFFFLDAYSILTSRPAPIRRSSLPSHLRDHKIFIASIFKNSEYMLRLYWNTRLIDLVRTLGPQNVFVSIVESGSLENTKGALKDLQNQLDQLGVKHRISLGINDKEQEAQWKKVPNEGEDRTGWIQTGSEKVGWAVRRIPYLAALRNQAMEPLVEMSNERKFDRVLWINDVVFSTEDVTTLLSTRDGAYAAACAFDFSHGPQVFYDTFVLRDSSGLKTSSRRYPYFFSSASRQSLYRNLPIPVSACWNGLIALDTSPFYASPPLKFRGISDSLAAEHLEGSECCLIHADNPLRKEKGIWMNPNVRVAYNGTVYSEVNGGTEIKSSYGDIAGVPGGDGSFWPGGLEVLRGTWENRFARRLKKIKIYSENKVVLTRVKAWMEKGKKLEPPENRVEPGVECLVNEMQVLFEGGWLHV
ncbi:related to polysaccharide export protein (CAP59) [Rhynchosporium agropyri]|uniref:Related to polysaccharide export protein (CAP59) n=1 Tax=Rhynchosporium agropyri TaxID=914238 RepID=A0A1E1KR23_9HELO|nr:related to polysaccharide export protein (CAP59) [Rhynchosporium agropyri]